MDARRAGEIASSPVMIDVRYNGSQIYIDRVDEKRQMAHIHFLREPYIAQEVSVNLLTEDRG